MFEVKSVRADGRYLILDVGSRFIAGKEADKIKPGKEYTCEIKQKRQRRSRDANAYFWAMCGKLAAVLRIPREEIYRELIKEIGDNYSVQWVQTDFKEKICEAWQSQGMGWLTEPTGRTSKAFTQIVFYIGSSHYDTSQMSRLIDLLLEECKVQGIETLSDREKSLMMEKWDAQTNKSDCD